MKSRDDVERKARELEITFIRDEDGIMMRQNGGAWGWFVDDERGLPAAQEWLQSTEQAIVARDERRAQEPKTRPW